MTHSPERDKQHLQRRLEDALARGSSAAELVELIIGEGWQPRPVPDEHAERLMGVLDDGTLVPVEIRHVLAHQPR